MSSDMGEYGGFEFSPSFSFGTSSGGFSAGGGSVPAYSGSSGGGGGASGGFAPSFGGLSGGSGGAAFGLTPGVSPSDSSFPDPTSVVSGADSFAERFGEWGPWGGDFSASGGGNFGQPQNPFEGGGQPVPFGDFQWPTGGMPSSAPPDEQTMGYDGAPSFQGAQGVQGWDRPLTGGAPREAPGLPGVGLPSDFSAQRAAPTGGAPPPPSSSGQKQGGTFLDRLAEGAISGLTRDPLRLAASGAGLAINMLKGNKDPEGLAELREAAGNLKSTGSVLQQYLTTGTLPPGMQASVDAATKAAKASIIQRHAARGLPTDPARNSALQQELAQLEQNAIITGATLGDKLMTQGISASGLSNQLYQAIMNLDRERSKQTSQAIANFAAALGGGGGGSPTKGTLTFG